MEGSKYYAYQLNEQANSIYLFNEILFSSTKEAIAGAGSSMN